MGLSDLESSRDGFGAYNCHRRANERSLVNVLERGPYLLLPLLPPPVLLFLLYPRLSSAGRAPRWASRELVHTRRPTFLLARSTAVACCRSSAGVGCCRRSLPL